jgi:enolase
MNIRHIRARQILDSRGNPTVEAEVILENGKFGRAAVPSGASTGVHEAVELRDGDKAYYMGKSVLQAVTNVTDTIGPALTGADVTDQSRVDQIMLELDGTENKSKLGANAILAVSLAAARAAAISQGQQLFEYISQFRQSETGTIKLPIPFFNVINGGKHAIDGVDFQEFMLAPHGFDTYSQALAAGAQVYHTLKKILHQDGYTVLVGDEGGFAPSFDKNDQALEYLIKAITEAGYEPGKQVAIAMDPAVAEIYDAESGKYKLATENRELSGPELIDYWADLLQRYPIVSLEDGLDQDAWEDWQALTAKLGNRLQLVGDDFLVTNPQRLQQAIDQSACNAILIKVNQIGTLTETFQTVNLALNNGFNAMVSHRSGETEDTFIADLVVGLGNGQIKSGALSRSERIAKYNQMLRIEEYLGDRAQYAGKDFFKS